MLANFWGLWSVETDLKFLLSYSGITQMLIKCVTYSQNQPVRLKFIVKGGELATTVVVVD